MGEDEMFIGDVEVAVVSDGVFKLDGGVLFGVVPRVLWQRVHGPDELNRLPLSLNSLLLRSAGRTILIETGFGTKLSQRQADNFALQRDTGLTDNLARLGVAPEDVDVIVNTHLHSDHCGGNTRVVNGELLPTFPRAEYWVQRAEWEDALAPNDRTRATYFAENLLPLQERECVKLLDGVTAVTPEVTCEPAPGHTPGHQVVWVRSQGRAAVCIGDMAQFPVQLERPVWTSAYDTAPITSLETKQQLLRRAYAEQALVFFVHHDLIASVEEHDGQYRLIPVSS
jgi:glyoxylase-like metal-dependent hydrolase (beta-lactamase superfamily II)